MLWLDSVLAIPSLGIRMEPQFARLPTYPQSLGPLLDDLYQEHGQVTLDSPKAMSFSFKTPDGFHHQVLPNDLLVSFGYTQASRAKAGELFELERVEVKPYSTLLRQVQERLVQILQRLWTGGDLAVSRVGLVASSRLRRDNLPPGVSSLIEHLAKPLGSLVKTETNLLAVLEKSETRRDQCHHTLSFNEEAQPDDVMLTLDWQRFWQSPQRFRADHLVEEIKTCTGAAMEYFERLGAGELRGA